VRQKDIRHAHAADGEGAIRQASTAAPAIQNNSGECFFDIIWSLLHKQLTLF
jgi:hypothetical protein